MNKKAYRLGCVSNSVQKTLDLILEKMKLKAFFECIYSNESLVKYPKTQPKPHPALYLLATLESGLSPEEILICEDSPIGKESAIKSGCHLCPIQSVEHLTLSLLETYITHYNKESSAKPWTQQQLWSQQPYIRNPNMKILIPMAGAGSRFKGIYDEIKPLIKLQNGHIGDNVRMIECVIQNINIYGHYIFLCQEEHIKQYNLKMLLPEYLPKNCKVDVISVPKLTEGAACTSLYAKHLINNSEPLLIVNSDQFMEWNLQECMNKFLYSYIEEKETKNTVDGGILTFQVETKDKKWSYVKMDPLTKKITEVKEKEPISNLATVGVYFWRKGSQYVKYCEQMIQKPQNKVNGEYYIAPVYNEAIEDGLHIIDYQIKKMWGLGTPEDLEKFNNEFLG